jgi:hypothetical protein
MRGLIRIGIVGIVIGWTVVAHASPASEAAARLTQAAAKLAQAYQLDNASQYDQALVVIEQGLVILSTDTGLLEPKGQAPFKRVHTGLLELKGQVLVKQLDYLGALEAFEKDVEAGASGANLKNAQLNIKTLSPVRTTFLDITVSSGPAVIHLDSRTVRAFCTAEPSCHKGWLPGAYRVLADRPGYQPWSGPVTLVAGKATKLAITLVEKPSVLTVTVAPSDATITVDDTVYTAPITIPAGSHRVTGKLAGHVTSSTEVVAHEGKPVQLEVSLTRRIAISLKPATAVLRLDDRPIAVEDGGLDVPAGHHVLVASAPGLAERRIEIQAERAADYAIVVALSPPMVPPPVFTPRRKIALVAGGVSLVALAGGAILGTQSKQRQDDAFKLCPSPTTPCAAAAQATDLNKQGQSRALEANVAYGVAAGVAVTAAVLWFTGGRVSAPESRVAVTPRLGAVAGLDLSLKF